MRFHQDGPDLPSDLLLARDEGRVVFFCGAGASRARAGLPDFRELTIDVVNRLGASRSGQARRVIDQLSKIDEVSQATGLSGLLPIDRIFGLLESEFEYTDIEQKIAESLRPKRPVDLSAHKILLDLATSPQGHVRIVTTNFDRLFSEANPHLRITEPRRIPNRPRVEEVAGIIHLHGMVDADYREAYGESLVLSTAEFGNAYLSGGWATQFVSWLLERFIVVFVGYGADDPPIQYLLEGLRKKGSDLSGIYAFHSAENDAALASWQQKGVEAIPYRADPSHSYLWESLSSWAERARNPVDWTERIISLAQKDPSSLSSCQRGQVAHICSTSDGMRRFAAATPPPPASWLLVFDPAQRFAKPNRLWQDNPRGLIVDPFEDYGLDSDPLPTRLDPDEPMQERSIPSGVWDGLSDDFRQQGSNISAIDSHTVRICVRDPMPLTGRLMHVCHWVCRVSNQPIALWWAAHQESLHDIAKENLRWQLRRSEFEISTSVLQGWRYLMEAWSGATNGIDQDYFALSDWTHSMGWSAATVRQLATLARPRLVANAPYSGPPLHGDAPEVLHIEHLVRFDVEYPLRPLEQEVPDECLRDAVAEMRKNLELAVALETEIGGYGLAGLGPIRKSSDPEVERFTRGRGLTAHLLYYVKLYRRLISFDPRAAREEIEAWPRQEDFVFARLRMWVINFPELISESRLMKIIGQVSRSAFWEPYNQRDLLLSLQDRWHALSAKSRRKIERRLMQGPVRHRSENMSEFNERSRWAILQRLGWLAESGCELSKPTLAFIDRIRVTATGRQKASVNRAVQSLEPRGGIVQPDTDPASLISIPLRQVVPRALAESSKRTRFLVEPNPFLGLVQDYPVRAFRALQVSAKSGEYPDKLWREFLSALRDREVMPRFAMVIAERLASYPDEALSPLTNPISDWLKDVSQELTDQYPATFDRIFDRITSTLANNPSVGASAIKRDKKNRDLVMEAINAPAGKLAQAAMDDIRKNPNGETSKFPIIWRQKVNELIGLPGELRRHALLIFAHNLHWFYAYDPDWTEEFLLSAINREDSLDAEAVWSGYFLSEIQITPELLVRLKSSLLKLVGDSTKRERKFLQGLAIVLLVGWAKDADEEHGRFVTDEEMREALLDGGDEFRRWILWVVDQKLNSDKDRERWVKKMSSLFDDVWPRQKAAKTSETSKELFELAFRHLDVFAEAAPKIETHLIRLSGRQVTTRVFVDKEAPLIRLYPRAALGLLYAVLPTDIAAWPYNVGEILDIVSKADSKISEDGRFLELTRRWRSR